MRILSPSLMIICIVTGICFLGGNQSAVAAAQVQSFSVGMQPSFQRVVIAPGRTVTTTLTLTNYGDPTLMTIAPYQLSFDDGADSATITAYDMRNPELPQIRSSWPQDIPGQTFAAPLLLTSDERASFDVSLDIPEGIPPGEYAVWIAAESRSSHGFQDASTLHIEGAVGSTIVLSVSDEPIIVPDAKLSDILIRRGHSIRIGNTAYLLIDTIAPIEGVIHLANSGRYGVMTEGEIAITQDNKTEQYNLSPTYVFPGGQKMLRIERAEGLPDTASFSIPIDGSFGGSIRIIASVELGQTDNRLEKTVEIVALPLTYIAWGLGVFGGIVLFILILYVKSRVSGGTPARIKG